MTLQPIAASGRPSGSLPGSARRNCCWRPQAIPTCFSGSSRHRAGRDLPSYRARTARAIGLPRQRHRGGPAVAGSDRQRRRDAVEPALARRRAAGPAAAGCEELRPGNDREIDHAPLATSDRSRVLIAFSGVLAGCSSGFGANFDPSDLLDFLDTKKKLPGERKPVFPDGVPGLEQGVPKDLYKGSAQERLDQQNAAAAAPRPRRRRGAEIKAGRQIQGQKQAARDRQHGACARGARSRRRAAAKRAPAAAPPAPKPEKIAAPHHRAAARPVGSAAVAVGRACAVHPLSHAVPGANAERLVSRADSRFVHSH